MSSVANEGVNPVAALRRAMLNNGHTVPNNNVEKHIKLQYNKWTGEKWCYCEKCLALGAIKEDGTMYGAASKKKCTGSGHGRRIHTVVAA